MILNSERRIVNFSPDEVLQFAHDMQMETALRWSWMNVLNTKRYRALTDAFGSLDAATEALDEDLLRKLGCRDDTVMRALTRVEEMDTEAYATALTKRKVRLITIEDDAYPSRLREMGDPPVFLYVRGDTAILEQPCIALVGTRDMTAYGKRVTEHIVPGLVRAGLVTVSGLAQGIDSAVAQETMRAGGKTVAVLGHGLGSIYPKQNAQLAEKITENGGLLISEYPLDTAPDKFTFPARNRIIAALSLGTVVLEAGEGSGSLITAELALEYGREVLAVPGQIFDPQVAGCHQLIAKGQARLVTDAEGICREIGVMAGKEAPRAVSAPENETQAMVWKLLTTLPQSLDELASRIELDPGSINATLTILELSGFASRVEGARWVRST